MLKTPKLITVTCSPTAGAQREGCLEAILGCQGRDRLKSLPRADSRDGILRPHRKAFGTVLEVAQRLADRLALHGGERPLDVDGALQCESFDVIGRVGFGHDFRATSDLAGPGAANCRTIKEGACMRALLLLLLLEATCACVCLFPSRAPQTAACLRAEAHAENCRCARARVCDGFATRAGCRDREVNDMRNPLRPILRAIHLPPRGACASYQSRAHGHQQPGPWGWNMAKVLVLDGACLTYLA